MRLQVASFSSLGALPPVTEQPVTRPLSPTESLNDTVPVYSRLIQLER